MDPCIPKSVTGANFGAPLFDIMTGRDG